MIMGLYKSEVIRCPNGLITDDGTGVKRNILQV
jgi:hypothetical protein